MSWIPKNPVARRVFTRARTSRVFSRTEVLGSAHEENAFSHRGPFVVRRRPSFSWSIRPRVHFFRSFSANFRLATAIPKDRFCEFRAHVQTPWNFSAAFRVSSSSEESIDIRLTHQAPRRTPTDDRHPPSAPEGAMSESPNRREALLNSSTNTPPMGFFPL
jgi:hypothetical protein